MNKPTLTAGKDRAAAAEELAGSIRTLLDQQQLSKARRTAAKAAKDYPDHSWLVQADRVLNPNRIVTRPAQGRGRALEFTWLRRHGATYRGKWVALLGDELITSAKTFQEVERAVQERTFENPPLVHYIG